MDLWSTVCSPLLPLCHSWPPLLVEINDTHMRVEKSLHRHGSLSHLSIKLISIRLKSDYRLADAYRTVSTFSVGLVINQKIQTVQRDDRHLFSGNILQKVTMRELSKGNRPNKQMTPIGHLIVTTCSL